MPNAPIAGNSMTHQASGYLHMGGHMGGPMLGVTQRTLVAPGCSPTRATVVPMVSTMSSPMRATNNLHIESQSQQHQMSPTSSPVRAARKLHGENQLQQQQMSPTSSPVRTGRMLHIEGHMQQQ